MTKAKKRTMYFDDELWNRVNLAAARAGVAEGKPLSTSEWLRAAVEEKLERQNQSEGEE